MLDFVFILNKGVLILRNKCGMAVVEIVVETVFCIICKLPIAIETFLFVCLLEFSHSVMRLRYGYIVDVQDFMQFKGFVLPNYDFSAVSCRL